MTLSFRKILISGAVAASLSVPLSAAEFINILTGGTSGIYYPLGVSLSQIYSKAMPDAKTAVQATKAVLKTLTFFKQGVGKRVFP